MSDTRFGSYLTAITTASRTPGIQYLVVTSTGVQFEHVSGWADIRHRMPVDPATTMMAYSMIGTCCESRRSVVFVRLPPESDMPIRTLTNRFSIPLAIVFATLSTPVTTRAASPRADDATGVWTARANAPGWNGRFTLALELQQVGDSVRGIARFQYDNAEFQTPIDVSGTNTNNKIELIDRKDMFKFMGTLRGRHLDGRIAHGSHDWKNAVGVGFERTDRTPNE